MYTYMYYMTKFNILYLITSFAFISDGNLSQFTIYYETDNGWLIIESIARLWSEVRYNT